MVTQNINSNITNCDDEAPCTLGCPIRQDGRDYIQLIARRKFEEAFKVVKRRNVIPSSCGRICTHPCEDKCRRKDLDSPLAIAWLKRFLGDLNISAPTESAEVKYDEKIAIIGGGPAGLAAAHDLAIMGYKVTVFEASGKPGGMIGIGVPVFRLPRKDIAKDVDVIRGLGVEFKVNTKVGTDITIDEIRNDGYGAIFITAGLPISKRIPIKGLELDGVMEAVTFLREANENGKANVADKVLVIGGGAVAMDCARTALRLGPKEVHVSCLESRKEMPTSDYEIEETLHEGVILHTSLGPKRILGEDGKVTGLETLKVQSVFDEQGRFNPSFHEGSEEVIEAGTIVLAIGQGSDLSLIDGIEGIETTRGGTIIVNKETFMTNVPGIFAGGDIVLGRGTMTMGLEHGKRAAFTIHNYLRNESCSDARFSDLTPIPDLAPRRVELIKRENKAEMPVMTDDKRKTTFDEVELGFDEDVAVKEAQRCMNCGAGAKVAPELCIGCLTCVRVCPFEIPVINDDNVAYIDGDCQSCGICVVECPAKAISFKTTFEDQGEDELKLAISDATVSADKPIVVNLFCHYSEFYKTNLKNGESLFADPKSGIKNVGVLGMSKINPSLLLHAFEQGAKGVMVSVCNDEDCHYGKSCMLWANRKIDKAVSLLSEVGVDNEKVKVVDINESKNNIVSVVNRLIN